MYDFPIDCNFIDKIDIIKHSQVFNDKEQYKIIFSLNKQVFIVLLSFSEPLTAKCLFLNDEPCMVGPTLIDLNSVDIKKYPFMNSCHILSPKICAPKKTKDINIKAFNDILTNENKANAMTKHISCKCKLNSTTWNSNQK